MFVASPRLWGTMRGMSRLELGAVGLVLVGATALLGCGPKTVSVKPGDVREVVVRPRDGQPVFCPGQPFEVEVVAQMNNGDVCSTTVPGRCAGSDKALLDKKQIVVTASAGIFDPSTMVLRPVEDPLATAAGMSLAGWVLGAEQKRATTVLRPVYPCMATSDYDAPPGAPGPALEIAATIISTPFYPRVTLVRIRSSDGGVRYVMSPVGQRLRILARGGQGYAGEQGSSGQQGASGSAGGMCQNGGAGGAGTPGGPGGPGGNGGPGGSILAAIDAAAFDEIAAQLDLLTPGGDPGPGGAGGQGGAGGAGGAAGSSDPKQCPSGGTAGPAGPAGSRGSDGSPGMEGPDGPPPKRTAQPRDVLFAAEMPRILELAGAPANGAATPATTGDGGGRKTGAGTR
jgi:hypothetical protein